MKVHWENVRFYAVVMAAAAVLMACPLPYDYHGKAPGASNSSDPSSPKITEGVTVSYVEEGAGSGTIANDGVLAATNTTTVTLSTDTDNSVIYYNDDGTKLTDLSKAKRITGSNGSFTLSRTEVFQTMEIYAVAVGPNMCPSLPAHATIGVGDKPVVTLTASPGSATDANNSVTFTVTSSFAPASNMTVNLTTGGTYTSADVSGIPASGTGITVTIPAGSVSATQSATTHHVIGNYTNKTVALSLVSGGLYAVGTSSPVSVSITNTSPVPVLTLSASASSITNAQTATLTVNASVAPEVNLPVTISSSGYRAGKVTIPTSISLPAGATSASFTVAPASGSYYEEQNPVVSISTGSHYTLGSTISKTIQITDPALGPFNFNGVWKFASGNTSKVGTTAGWTLQGSTTISGGKLDLSSAVYTVNNATVPVPSINQNGFTMAIKFTFSDLSVARAIFTVGSGYRAVAPWVDGNGNLHVDFNNHGIIGDPGVPDTSYTFTIPGLNISAGSTYTLVLDVDAANHQFTTTLNGTSVTLPLPSYFVWYWPSYDDLFLSEDPGTARFFKGTWDWVFAASGLLDYNTVVNMITSDPDL